MQYLGKKGRGVYHTGIVLKKLSTHKVAILDAQRGRLDGIIMKPICIGSLVDYGIEKERGTIVYISDCTITDLPFSLARHDLLFWHHVLELCFYFVPLGSYTPQLFELCTFLYTVDTDTSWLTRSKKLYLFKLLTTIGMYPRLPQLSPATLDHFIRLPLSAMVHEILDEQHEKKLDEWLRVCMSDHPAVMHFKTIHYLLGT